MSLTLARNAAGFSWGFILALSLIKKKEEEKTEMPVEMPGTVEITEPVEIPETVSMTEPARIPTDYLPFEEYAKAPTDVNPVYIPNIRDATPSFGDGYMVTFRIGSFILTTTFCAYIYLRFKYGKFLGLSRRAVLSDEIQLQLERNKNISFKTNEERQKLLTEFDKLKEAKAILEKKPEPSKPPETGDELILTSHGKSAVIFQQPEIKLPELEEVVVEKIDIYEKQDLEDEQKLEELAKSEPMNINVIEEELEEIFENAVETEQKLTESEKIENIQITTNVMTNEGKVVSETTTISVPETFARIIQEFRNEVDDETLKTIGEIAQGRNIIFNLSKLAVKKWQNGRLYSIIQSVVEQVENRGFILGGARELNIIKPVPSNPNDLPYVSILFQRAKGPASINYKKINLLLDTIKWDLPQEIETIILDAHIINLRVLHFTHNVHVELSTIRNMLEFLADNIPQLKNVINNFLKNPTALNYKLLMGASVDYLKNVEKIPEEKTLVIYRRIWQYMIGDYVLKRIPELFNIYGRIYSGNSMVVSRTIAENMIAGFFRKKSEIEAIARVLGDIRTFGQYTEQYRRYSDSYRVALAEFLNLLVKLYGQGYNISDYLILLKKAVIEEYGSEKSMEKEKLLNSISKLNVKRDKKIASYSARFRTLLFRIILTLKIKI